ncbi:DUF5129 domain-containing protein [Actinomyces sp. HMSC035G02]|uniref:DUF5129 domain-containing protein n=1 Tax=Actinomyces sp. HMSC035G02 TaxID=1739406 RepID=UPI0008A82DAD|nr:DUF5129 domain-containing protein [Actinomyces sp. HMSC035G02]OHR19667.1 hypothetical protein HMPREF2902_03740 [Actinomyces sp. HMSC035G02]
MVNIAPNSINAQATRESSRRSWSAVRGFARLILGLFLVLVAPLQLAIAVYDQAHHGMGEAVDWPNWTGWVMVLCGIGVLSRGAGLRRSGRQKMAEIAEKWAALERQRSEVERVFSDLVGAGHYEIGLTARHEHARAERTRVGARIAAHRSPGFFASLSEASGGAEDKILAQMDRLAHADAAIMAARDFFACAPGWRDVWKTEIGPIIEDLDVLDDVADTLESVNAAPGILAEIEAFRERVGDHKDTVNDLGKRLEAGQVGPAQALEELDRITGEARARTAELIEDSLLTDASPLGRQRYARWKDMGIRLTAANAEYDAAYWSQDADTDIEYNPAATIRLTANSAGVDFEGLPAPATGVLTAGHSPVYLLPMYLDRYLSDNLDEAGEGSSST